MCIKYDIVNLKCNECADEYVLTEYTFLDSNTNTNETVFICVLVNEHLNCESDLLKINLNKLEVKLIFL